MFWGQKAIAKVVPSLSLILARYKPESTVQLSILASNLCFHTPVSRQALVGVRILTQAEPVWRP